MKRLVIHAGFPKTASSSIQWGIGLHLARLNECGFYLLGERMKVGRHGEHPILPLWYLQEACREWSEGETLVDAIMKGFRNVGDATLILTSENLQQVEMPRLFLGIDKLVQTEIILYIRPQFDWIPSAWKQWTLKKGLTLEAFVNHCLVHGRPNNARSLDTWAEALPDAKIAARPLFNDFLIGANPVIDFFSLIGFSDCNPELVTDPVNPSVDYSILHVLMRNADRFFDGIHDNKILDAVIKDLPDKYKRTNIAMLSDEAAQRIEEHFRDENLYVLGAYTEIESPEFFYESHFLPRPTSISYMDMEEREILERCMGILSESIGTQPLAKHLGSMLMDMGKESTR